MGDKRRCIHKENFWFDKTFFTKGAVKPHDQIYKSLKLKTTNTGVLTWMMGMQRATKGHWQ